MKKELMILCGALMLMSSCSSTQDIVDSDWIECAKVSYASSGSAVFEKSYRTNYMHVYEYISKDGKKLYTNVKVRYNEEAATMQVFKNDYFGEMENYYYSRLVGFVQYEERYYLNLENRLIRSRIKCNEFKEDDPYIVEGEVNNKEALQCAKKGIYLIADYLTQITKDFSTSTIMEEYIYELKVNDRLDNLEKNIYYQVGDYYSISYTEK